MIGGASSLLAGAVTVAAGFGQLAHDQGDVSLAHLLGVPASADYTGDYLLIALGFGLLALGVALIVARVLAGRRDID